MGGFKRTIMEMFIIGTLAVGIALGTNALRVTGSIKINKAYFDKGSVKIAADATPLSTQAERSQPEPVDLRRTSSGENAEVHIDHDYQDITTERVAKIVSNPDTGMGLNFIIDARDDESFEEGHISGAIQVNYYEIERYLDDVLLERMAAAENIVVYCNGGSCEDSIFLCRELINEYGVDYDRVFLYAGGWEAWTAKGHPTATGRE